MSLTLFARWMATLLVALLSISCSNAVDTLEKNPRQEVKPEVPVPREITYPSSADKTQQPAMLYLPQAKEPVPLLVVLHTWNGDYKQNFHADAARWCVENGWAYVHPHFRGPNNNPSATGSELVIKDIESAVRHVQQAAPIDERRIYLLGTSGGGYAALLMAARKPGIWAGVSAWVPIADLKTWNRETKQAGLPYWKDIAASCGGAPGESATVDDEYARRSPLTHLREQRLLPPLDINAGIHDGHKGNSVPVSHSLRAFNAVAAPADRFEESDILSITEKEAIPAALQEPITDEAYGANIPLLRRSSGSARVTLFEGGHELVFKAAIAWLSQQKKITEPAA